MTSRALRRTLGSLLERGDIEQCLTELEALPPIRAVNALLPFLASADSAVQCRAVSVIGAATEKLADSDLESARVVMRRLMWSLFEESGAIGWGAPEAMGEVMARHDGLAKEFTKILVSYTREDGNFLEHEPLQRGVLWGIGRVAQVRPEYLLEFDTTDSVQPYLDSSDPAVRGLAAWVCGLLRIQEARKRLESLRSDSSELRFCLEQRIVTKRVEDLVQEALQRLDER